jgi:hypothetical protein
MPNSDNMGAKLLRSDEWKELNPNWIHRWLPIEKTYELAAQQASAIADST